MRKNILLAVLLSSAIFANAQDSLSISAKAYPPTGEQSSGNNIRYVTFPKLMYKKTGIQSEQERDQETEFINESFLNGISSNWFVNIAGGMSTFIGQPLGCADLFGRTRPMFHASLGKWFSSTVGGRIAFQGFNLKNHLIEQQNYYHVHADFLWNMTNLFHHGKTESRWQVIPFVGTGIIQNKISHPFAFNYGILNQVRLHDRLSLSLELGGLTTFGDFDGAGKGNKFTDHLFHLSAGISLTLGKTGWRHTTNHRSDNAHITTVNKLRQLEKEKELNNKVIVQARKILEIEGLLSRFQDELAKSGISLSPDSVIASDDILYYPTNDYSGLNSLRKRLSAILQNQADSDEELYTENLLEDSKNRTSDISNDSSAITDSLLSPSSAKKHLSGTQVYINQLLSRKECIGAPILFFFHIGTSRLIDPSQLANVDEIVRICKKYDLRLKVTGYADSATGNPDGNTALSNQRAEYITSELKKRGIFTKSILSEGRGGIDTYSPDAVNRCTKIEIYLK